MSVPVVSITRRDGRLVFVFKRDGILEGWVYLDEVSEEQRATFLRMLETQEMSDLRKIDVNNTTGPASQEEKTKLKDERPDYSAADEEKDKGIFKLLFDALEKRQAVHGSREELDAMMAAVSAEIKARKERGEIKTREQETQEMGKYIGAIFAFREYERRRGMAAMHEQPGPEAAYKKGDIIGGKYEVGAMLGSGGFGEVYLVYDRRTLGLGALKTFRQKFLADAEVRENFKREALLWVNLEEHPFILAARFVEEFSGRLFIGMDYIAPDDRGRVTLADHLAHCPGAVGDRPSTPVGEHVLLWHGARQPARHQVPPGHQADQHPHPAGRHAPHQRFRSGGSSGSGVEGSGRLVGERRRGRLRRLEPIPDGGQTGLRHTGVPCAGGIPWGRGRRAE